MSAYDKLAQIDAEIRTGRTTLVQVLDFLRVNRLDGYTRPQLVAATAKNDAPEQGSAPKPKPEPIRRRRKARS